MLSGGSVAMATQALGADRGCGPTAHTLQKGSGTCLGDAFLSRGPGPGTPLRGTRLSLLTPTPSLTGLRCYTLTPCGCSVPPADLGGKPPRALQSASSTP